MQGETSMLAESIPYASVKEATRAYVSAWLSKHVTALVLPLCVAIGLVGWAVFAEQSLMLAWLQLLWVPVMGVVVIWGYVYTQGIALFYKGIAAEWHWEYVARVTPSGYAAALFRVGHGQVLRNMVSGVVGATPASMANLQYTIGSGKSARTYSNTVAMLTLSERVPHLLLAVDKDRFDTHVLSQVSHFVSVPLEGEFEERLGLYVESGFELEALQIISPALLHKINTLWPEYSLEFVGSELYVYAPRVLQTRTEVEQLLALLQYASYELRPRLAALQGSIAAMREVSKKSV